MRKTRCLAALLAFLLLFCPRAARADAPLIREWPQDLDSDAASILLLDARSGAVILEKNADEMRPAASLTKLMTMLLALEALDGLHGLGDLRFELDRLPARLKRLFYIRLAGAVRGAALH